MTYNILKLTARAFALLVAAATSVIAPCPAAEVDFSHDIVPVLREHCGQCHTGGEKQGGLSMNTRESLLAGGDLGGDVIPGESGKSELIARVSSDDDDLRMPPEGDRLPAAKVALLRTWIDAGASWEPGFAFQKSAYEPPLLPRRPALPPAVDGRENPVDRIVDAYLAEHDIRRLQPVDDATFLRRVSLDVVGLLPTPERLAEFLADDRPDKRARFVDDLLADDVAYAEHWLTFWNDLLRNDYAGTGFITGGRKQITDWLYRSLIDNKPYDQFVSELIAPTPESEGFIQGIRWRGDVSASQTQEIQFAQNITQAFLGINMKCASCHNSFIDRWTLDETYGLAAIYATQPLEIHRCDKPVGRQAEAAWIFPELGQISPDAPQPERLQQLAALITHPDNGRFTRTMVNRIWHRLMGRGIVHPVDAMHTPPWSADLLDYLGVDLADHGYDLKQTIRLICTSQAYQAMTPPLEAVPESGAYVFRGPLTRRMTAEQFLDAVWQITGAGPSKADVSLLRARLTPPDAAAEGDTAAPRSPSDLVGKWIWSYPEASGAVPAAGESVTMRRQFELPAAPTYAAAVLTCD
ncbi:MAG: PSD1 and planctomycete cytochrome C domain-containing protein, partial [Planctomycetes bacterium]|nr:PSD1 and planctomycete cytochrome C domain-containing protein [Planctomycetota bacterium]